MRTLLALLAVISMGCGVEVQGESASDVESAESSQELCGHPGAYRCSTNGIWYQTFSACRSACAGGSCSYACWQP